MTCVASTALSFGGKPSPLSVLLVVVVVVDFVVRFVAVVRPVDFVDVAVRVPADLVAVFVERALVASLSVASVLSAIISCNNCFKVADMVELQVLAEATPSRTRSTWALGGAMFYV